MSLDSSLSLFNKELMELLFNEDIPTIDLSDKDNIKINQRILSSSEILRMIKETEDDLLMRAIREGKIKAVQSLLKNGADINQVSINERPKTEPIDARIGDDDIDQLLKEAAPDTAKNIPKTTPFATALLTENPEMIELIASQKLFSDVRRSNFQSIQSTLDQIADPTIKKQILLQTDHNGQSLLHLLVKASAQDNELRAKAHIFIKYILKEAGSEVEQKKLLQLPDKDNKIASHYSHHTRIISELTPPYLSQEEKTSMLNSHPIISSAFTFAKAGKTRELQDLLSKNIQMQKIIMDTQDERGDSILQAATGHTQTILLLSRIKDKMNVRSADEISVNLDAKDAALQALAERRANQDKRLHPDIKPGDRPLHTAIREGKVVIAAKLILDGADVNAQNDEGQTPSHIAAGLRDKRTLALLVKREARVDILDQHGQTPLDIAKSQDSKEMVDILVDGSRKQAKDNKFKDKNDDSAISAGNTKNIKGLFDNASNLSSNPTKARASLPIELTIIKEKLPDDLQKQVESFLSKGRECWSHREDDNFTSDIKKESAELAEKLSVANQLKNCPEGAHDKAQKTDDRKTYNIDLSKLKGQKILMPRFNEDGSNMLSSDGKPIMDMLHIGDDGKIIGGTIIPPKERSSIENHLIEDLKKIHKVQEQSQQIIKDMDLSPKAKDVVQTDTPPKSIIAIPLT